VKAAQNILSLPPGEGLVYAPVCAALHEQAFPDPWDATAFAELLSDPTVHAWIGHSSSGEESAPMAVLLCRVVIDEAEILTIATCPDQRRSGWGKALMQAAQNHFHTHGVDQWFLEVAAENTAAQALYHRHGFTKVGLRKGYYAPLAAELPRRDALVMSASLKI
jgi:ribosomal-protein-alanine N-acetyltransferase